jgi:lantibiotic modifying enzyme
MLFRPEAFEPLTDEGWSEAHVRDGIARIAADVDDAFDPERMWPADEWDVWGLEAPLTGLYVGAAGVVWALDVLRRRGYAECRLDLPAVSRQALDRWRARPDLVEEWQLPAAAGAGLLNGETGVLAVAWKLSGRAELADDLVGRVAESRASEADEVMWGMPGALLAARAMVDWTGEERWAIAWRETAEALWDRRDDDGLWTQDLYGRSARILGAAHGVVGNALALIRGGDLLPANRQKQLIDDTSAVLQRNAVVEDGLANWPGADGNPLEGSDGEIRLQWCNGAPGIVISTADYLSEELLLAGAELTWRAGPPGMEKGPSICHGTAGNGYAFLKTFARTGDELWLDRARRFAVHALEQVGRRGQGRYSLWTGDLGVALFAADCLEARTAYPIMDTWE